MTIPTCTDAPIRTLAERPGTGTGSDALAGETELDVQAEGWQALAHATLGRPLNRAELAAVESLAPAHALDLLFPDLPDPARQEALWALG